MLHPFLHRDTCMQGSARGYQTKLPIDAHSRPSDRQRSAARAPYYLETNFHRSLLPSTQRNPEAHICTGPPAGRGVQGAAPLPSVIPSHRRPPHCCFCNINQCCCRCRFFKTGFSSSSPSPSPRPCPRPLALLLLLVLILILKTARGASCASC